MKKNKKILLKIVLTASLSLQIATASVLADPVIIGVDVLPDAVAKNQTDLHQQFQKLVSQKNYVDALAVLHTQCQGDSLFMIKEIFQLPDHELSRKIMNLLIDTKMPNSKQMDSLHSYAVTLARNENFVDSLQLLRWLYQNAADDQTIIYDYIVVLNWAGNNDEAVDVFEKVNLVNPPQYVLNSVAGAYYRLQKYQTALIYAQEAAAQENPPSLILLAQINYGLGNYKKGNEIYNRLLKANPKDLELLRNRASVEMQTKQYEDALDDFNQVELLSADLPNAQDIKRSLDHDMAVAYIRENDEPQAILLLRPYIEAGTTDVFIQSDYILALRNYRDYKTAIQAGTRLWLDWKKIPIFGLQALGDCYLYSGDMDKALQIYSSILTRSPNLNGAKEGKAFVYMMTGKLDKGCALYDSLIITDTAVADVVLNDAYYFYKQGIFEASNRLYALLVKHFPSNAVYRDAYAKSLSTNNMYRDSYYQYKGLSSIRGSELDGLLGMTATALDAGAYNQADASLSMMKNIDSANELTALAQKEYDSRQIGNANGGFTYSRDYLGIKHLIWDANAAQSIGGTNLSILTDFSHERLTDESVNPDVSTEIDSRGVGVGVKEVRSDLQAWYYNYQNDGLSSGYKLISNYYPTDRITLGLDISRGPLIYSPQSLQPGLAGDTDSRIMTDNYTLRSHIRDGKTNEYDLYFTRGFYSDDNQANALGMSWNKTLLYNDSKEIYRFLFWDHNTWVFERDELYYSPPIMDTTGIGWSEKWKFQGHYWEVNVTPLEWERDRPSNTNWQPFLRLEYGRHFNSHGMLVLGAEYGVRTDLEDGSHSPEHFSENKYDVNYKINW